MKNKLTYCATDNEIYEVLMSAKQKITDAVLLELAKDRGIFYSHKDCRETLVEMLSLLPHDYHDLGEILEHREHAGRTEKLTHITLDTMLSIEDIKTVAGDYREDSPSDEKVVTHQEGTNQYVVQVQYSEIDHSKTRLIQRKPKVADIQFIVENNKTIVRMPANSKALKTFENLKSRLEQRKKSELAMIQIDLSEFGRAESKTQFFTSLISSVSSFALDNVTSVRVEPIRKESDEDAIDLDDDQEQEQAKQEALALVKKVALSGEDLLLSEEYQSLRKKGFFITSIIWRAKQKNAPHSIIEFEAAFEDPHAGTGFKYAVRGELRMLRAGEYTKTLRAIDDEHKQYLLSSLEKTAAAVMLELRQNEAAAKVLHPLQEGM